MQILSDLSAFLTSPDGLIVSIPALVVGLWLFVRGLVAYRDEARVGDIATSRIASLAAGEVRLSGTIEAAEVTLTSPLQSVPCVYYRSRITEDRSDTRRKVLDEERAVSFRIRDASGSVRVVPSGRVDWNVADRWQERTDLDGDEPLGLNRNRGAATTLTDVDRAVAIADLLTVKQPMPLDDDGGPTLAVGLGQRQWADVLGGAPGTGRGDHHRRRCSAVSRPRDRAGQAAPDRGPGAGGRPRGGAGARPSGRDAGGGLGQRRHPWLRHRAADPGAGARS